MANIVTGEWYYKIDGQLLEIKRQLRQSSGYPFDPAQLSVVLQNAIEGRFAAVEEKKKKKPLEPTLTFSIAATTNLPALAGKKTKKCFTGSRYTYRDGGFDKWLPKSQPSAEACAIAVLVPSQDWAFREAAARILGLDVKTDIAVLGHALIENGHTITLVQAEDMVDRTEKGEATGLKTDGWGNLFFVETKNPKDPVSVGYVLRGDRDWVVIVSGLDDDGRWSADYRLLLRNFDPSKLGF